MVNGRTKAKENMARRLAGFFSREYDSVLLFVGIFLLLYLGMNLVRSRILMENLMKPEYFYQEEYMTDSVWTEDELDHAADLFAGYGDNFVLRGVCGAVGYTNDLQELQLYLSAEALVKKKKLDGVKWNETPNSVLIEGRLKPRSYLRNGERWIIISGMEFRVCEIIDEDEILAQTVLLNWTNMDEEHRKRYLERMHYTVDELRDGIVVRLQSIVKFQEEAKLFETEYKESLREVKNFGDYQKWRRQEIFEKMLKFYFFMELMGAFCVYYLTELWISRRKREYLIRRMLGSSMLRLLGKAITDAGIATALAFALAVLVERLQLELHIAGKLEVREVLWTTTYALLITLGIEFMMLGIHILRLINVYPTQGNIEMAE